MQPISQAFKRLDSLQKAVWRGTVSRVTAAGVIRMGIKVALSQGTAE